MDKVRADLAGHAGVLDSTAQNQARFVALWRRCLADVPVRAEVVYAELERFYAEPHRRYHTLAHIRHCLKQFDLASKLMENADAVEMALWFHDAIYVPGATDNEWRSVELFRHWARGAMDTVFCQLVQELIMVTTHRHLPQYRDEQFIVDIDLSSFGLPWEDFLRDGRRLREEAGSFSDDEYYPAHLRFLIALRDRPTFFLTDFFRGLYEGIARANVFRIIETLQTFKRIHTLGATD